MVQMTLRLPDGLARRLKQAAKDRGSSLNHYACQVLAAAGQGRPLADLVSEDRD